MPVVAETVRQWLDDLLYQVEDKVDFECRMHEQYHGAALACAEAIKRRTFGRQLAWNQGGEAQWLLVRRFFDALRSAKREWADAYPGEKCSLCNRHIAWCECRAPCCKCGVRVPRRAWKVCEIFPENDMCACEKILNFGMRQFG